MVWIKEFTEFCANIRKEKDKDIDYFFKILSRFSCNKVHIIFVRGKHSSKNCSIFHPNANKVCFQFFDFARTMGKTTAHIGKIWVFASWRCIFYLPQENRLGLKYAWYSYPFFPTTGTKFHGPNYSFSRDSPDVRNSITNVSTISREYFPMAKIHFLFQANVFFFISLDMNGT